jgi:hypothetical protein
LQIVLVNVFGKLLGAGVDQIKRLLGARTRHKKVKQEVKKLKKAVEKHDDNTPLTEEQKRAVIDAARELVNNY